MWPRKKSASRGPLRKQQVDSEPSRGSGRGVADVTKKKSAAECGGTEYVKQSVHNNRTGGYAESLYQDIRFGFRQLRRNRTYSLTAILTLAIGIGATTAIFSAVYVLLLRPPPIWTRTG